MRWLLFAWLAACYRPAGDADCAISCETTACPDGLSCDQGLCHGSAVPSCAPLDAPQPNDGAAMPFDAPPMRDGDPTPPACVLPTFSTEATLLNGTSYVVDADVGRAVFDNGVDFAVIGGNVGGTGTVILDSARTTFALRSPRLTYDGQQLFFAGSEGNNAVLMRSDFRDGAFQSPIEVTNVVLTMGFVPGTVSETSPRHMVIEVAGSFYEGTEAADTGIWTFADAPFKYSMLQISEPSLSADGLTLVFAATDTATKHQIYSATRATIADPFASSTPQPLYNSTQGIATEGTPFLAADCRSLYFSVGTTVKLATP